MNKTYRVIMQTVTQSETDLSRVRRVRLEKGVRAQESQTLSPHSRDNVQN